MVGRMTQGLAHGRNAHHDDVLVYRDQDGQAALVPADNAPGAVAAAFLGTGHTVRAGASSFEWFRRPDPKADWVC